MLSWIAGFVGRWTGVVSNDIRDLVHWGLHALASVVYTVFGNVGKAWGELYQALTWMHQAADDFSGWVTQRFTDLIRVDLPRIWSYAVGAFKAAESLALRYYRLALAGLQSLRQLARQWVDDALQWVTVHVWDPLVSITKQLRSDLLKWGYWAYQLLNDPPRLAGILLNALVGAAESAFWRLAGPVGLFGLRLFVANLQRVLSLLEAIVAAVL